MNAETSLAPIALAGVVLAIIGLIWLFIAAFRVKWTWGLLMVIFLPITLPVFLVRHFRKAAWPTFLIGLGLMVGSAPLIYNILNPIDLGPYEKVVGGELHLTLTKWDRKDYSILAGKPDVMVLQMANPDVTDATLINLKGMTWLRELDLSHTQVGDAGLKELEAITGLQTLRLRDTKVTDEGFKKWLAPRGGLKQLDLQGTAVTKEAGKAWRVAVPGRRLLQ